MPFEKFDEFWNPNNSRTCGYCGVSEGNIEELKKQKKIKINKKCTEKSNNYVILILYFFKQNIFFDFKNVSMLK